MNESSEVRISALRPATLTEVIRNFPLLLQVDAGTAS